MYGTLGLASFSTFAERFLTPSKASRQLQLEEMSYHVTIVSCLLTNYC